MATAIKKCRVCGKPYETCHTTKRVAGVFRWQEVACSPECGSIYLAKIEASRGVMRDGATPLPEIKTVEDNFNILIYDEEQEMYEAELDEYFDIDAE